MPRRPGTPKTGGRAKGQRNKATIERALRAKTGIKAAIDGGLLPLDILLIVMRGGRAAEKISDRQFAAAVAAAPYIHPKMAVIKEVPEDMPIWAIVVPAKAPRYDTLSETVVTQLEAPVAARHEGSPRTALDGQPSIQTPDGRDGDDFRGAACTRRAPRGLLRESY